MVAYSDPRFQPLYNELDAAWSNPTAMVYSILGKGHPPGYSTFIDDPEVDGIVVTPEYDYQDSSSPFILAKSISPAKLANIDQAGVYIFDDMWLQVQRLFFVDYGFLLLGVLQSIK